MSVLTLLVRRDALGNARRGSIAGDASILNSGLAALIVDRDAT